MFRVLIYLRILVLGTGESGPHGCHANTGWWRESAWDCKYIVDLLAMETV